MASRTRPHSLPMEGGDVPKRTIAEVTKLRGKMDEFWGFGTNAEEGFDSIYDSRSKGVVAIELIPPGFGVQIISPHLCLQRRSNKIHQTSNGLYGRGVLPVGHPPSCYQNVRFSSDEMQSSISWFNGRAFHSSNLGAVVTNTLSTASHDPDATPARSPGPSLISSCTLTGNKKLDAAYKELLEMAD
ncbi:hypothetical protein HPP92_012143 [Vanilla planifolia]|uniref:Uncharacterized protein n=1 Tax=Vanilla planifolia TaxID=51239 RepID=A0A835V2H0_VANPL|nr:hypothetical protein HPP92_012143 [Vanilla planifolia]